MLDAVSAYSDAVTELLLEGESIPAELIKKEIRTAVLKRQYIPFLCGASRRNIGIQPLIDAIVDYLPAPDEVAPAEGIQLKKETPVSIPCTPLGCALILKDRLGDLSGKRAIVIGRSNIVGKPMAALLLAANATVTIAHSRTADLAARCREADIVIAAVGKPELVRGDWLKAGATVLDVGINRIAEGEKTRLVGDVHFASAVAVAGAITPVPGGIGPMTIACLLRNTLACAKALHGTHD